MFGRRRIGWLVLLIGLGEPSFASASGEIGPAIEPASPVETVLVRLAESPGGLAEEAAESELAWRLDDPERSYTSEPLWNHVGTLAEAFGPGVEVPLHSGALLSIESATIWAPVVGLAPDNAEQEVPWRPAAWLEGRLPRSVDADRLDLRLAETVDGVSGWSRHPSFDISCPLSPGSAWRCPVPAGRFQLRWSLAGYVPGYLWDVEIEAGQTLELGDLRPVRGASVAGWVVLPDPVGFDQVELALEPSTVRSADRVGEPASSSLALRRHETAPDDRGFFQFVGVPAGQYRLVARGEDVSETVRSPIEVLERSESLLEEPLSVSPPARIDVLLDPPTAPDGQPWHLSLLAVEERREAAAGWADWGGTWSSRGLSAGRYLLVVGDREGPISSRFHVETFDLPAGASSRLIDLEIVEVEGTLRDEESAVAGTIWFGGRHGADSIEIRTDEAGRFSGFVPREGEWKVQVALDHQSEQSLDSVWIERASDGGPTTLDLVLPSTRVAGRVVDAEGRPVGAAQVRVLRA